MTYGSRYAGQSVIALIFCVTSWFSSEFVFHCCFCLYCSLIQVFEFTFTSLINAILEIHKKKYRLQIWLCYYRTLYLRRICEIGEQEILRLPKVTSDHQFSMRFVLLNYKLSVAIICLFPLSFDHCVPSQSCSYGSSIYNYLCRGGSRICAERREARKFLGYFV